MKLKIINIILGIFIFIPFLNVNAWSCYGSSKEQAIDLSETKNFSCDKIEGDSLTFTYNGNDVSKHFKLNEDKSRIDIIDSSLTFSPDFENGLVVVTDVGNPNNTTTIYIKNTAYTTTTTTTTTKDANTKTVTVTFDPNDGNEITTESCDIKSGETFCYMNLPKINKDTFSGWGTAKTCKEGNEGSIKVEKDVTYYACYTTNDNNSNNETTNKTLLLTTLSLTDISTNESIDFGTFSIKKNDYSFKVLYEVENINVDARAEEGIIVEVTGNENLTVGENKIIIKLTDEQNNVNEYTLNVTRLEEGETINNIHYLKSLVIGGYEINFNKETFVYNLTISNDLEKLEITAIPENEEDTREILNNENLIDGSEIKINVTGEDEETTSYIINITKESNMNYWLLGAIGLILVLIIILIILIIIKSNKKKSNNQSKKNKKTVEQIETLNI